MNFIVAADTDIGNVKSTNQDSLSVKVINSKSGRMVFALLCDGMGGLSKGEVASAAVVRAFEDWVDVRLRSLSEETLDFEAVKSDWEEIVRDNNIKLHKYGGSLGLSLGTTLCALLIANGEYFCMNVGDSRAYVLRDNLIQITKDQTFVAREVEMGRMTEEEAQKDSRRSVLLQCVGASDYVYPAFYKDVVMQNDSFMLCCDGFIHEIKPSEIYESLCSYNNYDEYTMQKHIRELIDLNKSRNERDNISAILVRTF